MGGCAKGLATKDDWMSDQLPLFEDERPVYRGKTDAEIDQGWEDRLLSDMREAPVVCCFPGFTGAICERLVSRGLAIREDTGFMEIKDPAGMMESDKIITPRRAKAIMNGYWAAPFPQFRYSAT